jgi:hypothetical protein
MFFLLPLLLERNISILETVGECFSSVSQYESASCCVIPRWMFWFVWPDQQNGFWKKLVALSITFSIFCVVFFQSAILRVSSSHSLMLSELYLFLSFRIYVFSLVQAQMPFSWQLLLNLFCLSISSPDDLPGPSVS